jgi:uncharacterized protein
MPELTPIRDSRLRLVQRYGEGRFRISGESFEGSVIVFSDRVEKAPAESIAETGAEALLGILGEDAVDILLVGCGGAIPRLGPDFTATLKAAGVAAEPMDTGAACRTFNVLASEGRRVAALLIAVE